MGARQNFGGAAGRGEFGGAGARQNFGGAGARGEFGNRNIQPGRGENPFAGRGEGAGNRGEFNRNDINGGNFNRNNINRGEFNRNDINGGNFNRNNVNSFNREFRNTNLTNNNFNNFNRNNYVHNWNHPANGWGYRPGWWYHRGWVNGYWWGHNNNYWGGFWGGYGLGMLSGWGFGSALWGWGYMPYYNPYYISQPVVVQQPVAVQQPVYNYSQPINTEAPPVDDDKSDPAVDAFGQARTAFKSGDYDQALALDAKAMETLPNDATLHEFRALALFAQKRYDESAAALYAVLSVGPGWDWTTMIGLYPSVEVYTEQLRALEAYRSANPNSAAGHFVLAYHYLTEGHPEAAVPELQQVVRLQPKDTVSAGLLETLKKGASLAQSGDAAPPAPPAENAEPAKPAGPPISLQALAGSWSAQPAPGTIIKLTLEVGGDFKWSVTQGGQTHDFAGEATAGADLLTLARSDGGATLVGRVTQNGNDSFTFRVINGPPDDKGLSFTRGK
jgi:hypothetical protein